MDFCWFLGIKIFRKTQFGSYHACLKKSIILEEIYPAKPAYIHGRHGRSMKICEHPGARRMKMVMYFRVVLKLKNPIYKNV